MHELQSQIYVPVERRITCRNHLPMHVVCIGHLKNKTPGACARMEPGPRPDGNQPRIAPHGRVAPCVSQPLCSAAEEEMALQIAQGDDRMWLLRRCLPEQVPQWKRSPAGGPGRCGLIKGFPTAKAPGAAAARLAWQRRACHRVCAIPPRPEESFTGSAVGKQPEDPCCGSG